MSFQAAVAAWCAAHIVADMPVGARFGLAADIKATSIQCETGTGLDDVVLTVPGGELSIQCKTQLSLEPSSASAIAKTIAQLVRFDNELAEAGKDYAKSAAVLAVRQDAPGSLDELEIGLRSFDLGETWPGALGRLARKPKRALQIFEIHARAAWQTVQGGFPTEQDLVRLARLFRIRRFDEGPASADWREASYLLGRRVYGGEESGTAPLNTLTSVSRRLIRSGALADREGLLRELRDAGHVDIAAPEFDADIARVREYSAAERRRLKRHTELPIGNGLPLKRDCLAPLLASLGDEILLVTGEPGAGKTGVLLAFANSLSDSNVPVVFLSAERLAGFTTIDDFRRQLQLEHGLVDVLASWPAGATGVLIIDALDASRGGPGEEVIASFIEDIVAKLKGCWSVVASIRSFDLRNGRRFRALAKGRAPNPIYAEKGLESIRHFCVPTLSSAEIEAAGQHASELHALYATAPVHLQALLANLFNLSIASELLNTGTSPESIRALSTQSQLIEAYEDDRLPTQAARRAARATVETMIAQRKLAVRNVDIPSDEVDMLLRSGVANESSDLVSFSHHVLFDHIAGRFYLDRNNLGVLRQQVSSDPLAGLLLGPALRFALEMLWSEDNATRDITWQFLAEMAAADAPDPVVVSVGIRTAVDRVEQLSDVAALIRRIALQPEAVGLPMLVNQVARFVDLSTRSREIGDTVIVAWAQLAEIAARSRNRSLADAARVLLWRLIEVADFSRTAVLSSCGEAARTLLSTAWSLEPEMSHLSTQAIRMVTRTFGADPTASRELLEQTLEAERLEKHAAEEVLWLAEGIDHIVQCDPSFAADIFKALFTYEPNKDEKTWIGGTPSRILGLTSTVRQDYEHARWQLKEALPGFLKAAPEQAVLAVVQSLIGLSSNSYRSRRIAAAIEIEVDEHTVVVLDDVYGLEEWRSKNFRPGDSEDEILFRFAEFLQTCPDDVFVRVLDVVSKTSASAAVWARILGVAAEEKLGLADDQLWRLASTPRFAAITGLARDAIIFLGAVYGTRSIEERTAFEARALEENIFADDQHRNWWRSLLRRFLSVVSEEELATPAMKALRNEFAVAGELTGNEPFVVTSSGWTRGDTDVVDSILRSDGVDLDDDGVKLVRSATRLLEGLIRPSENKASDLVELWRQVEVLRQLLDQSYEPSLPEPVLHSSWGAVSNAVEAIAQAESYSPEAEGLPTLDELAAILFR
jgi:SpoVK/Ycf46/Vps4 family AAA+-type ATPase